MSGSDSSHKRDVVQAVYMPMYYASELHKFVVRAVLEYNRSSDEPKEMLELKNKLHKLLNKLAYRTVWGHDEATILASNEFREAVETLNKMYEIAVDVAEKALSKNPQSEVVAEYIHVLPYSVDYHSDVVYNDYCSEHQNVVAELIEGLTGLPTYIEDILASDDEFPVLVAVFGTEVSGDAHELKSVLKYRSFDDPDPIGLF